MPPADSPSRSSERANVTVREVAHDRRVQDRVIFLSDMLAGGTPQGDPMTGSYFIKTIVDDDHYTIEIPNPVPFVDGVNYGTGQYEITAYGGGPLVSQYAVFRYPIQSGLVVGQPGGGYGTGYYSGGGYGGDVGLFAVADSARIWSLDHWGENLVACYNGSPIYEWNFANGPQNPAYRLPGAPDQVGALFVSEEERILVALGATALDGVYDPKLVRWSDQENNQQWIPTETNYAGDLRAEKGTRLMGSISTISGHLILTATSVYIFRFIGQPFIFSLTFVEENCGLAAPHGIAKIDDIAFWISTTGFYLFDGTARRVPCSMQETLFGDTDTPGLISVTQMELICAGENKRFNEIIFNIPTQEGGDVDKTVGLQMTDGTPIWWMGDRARTTWVDDDAFLAYPVATKVDGTITVQEYGLNDGSDPLPYSITTSDIDISDGSQLMLVSKIVLDFKRLSGKHKVDVIGKDYPMGEDQQLSTATEEITPGVSFVNPRVRGRSVSFTLYSNELSTEFRMGQPRIGTKALGRRGQ